MTALAPAPAAPVPTLATLYARALVMPEVAVRLPAVTVMEHGVTRLPTSRVSQERLYPSEHFFFWMTVIENMPEYTFQRALSYADPDNVEELAQLAGRFRLETVEPVYWHPARDEVLALYSRSGEFQGVRLSASSGETTPAGAECIASIWFPPILLERMSLALLAASCRNARDDGFKPLSAELASLVLPVANHLEKPSNIVPTNPPCKNKMLNEQQRPPSRQRPARRCWQVLRRQRQGVRRARHRQCCL